MTAVRHTNISKFSTNEQDMNKDSSKVVTFYKNGDAYFSGYVVTITPRRYRSFEVLLSELSRITNLPQGVRYLLDRESGSRIEAIEQLQDGKAYVCASNSRLKKLDYGKKNGVLPQWGSKNKIELPALTNPPKMHGNHASTRYAVPLAHTRHAGTRQEAPRNTERFSYKARNVTIIRNGYKPRISTRVLLSKRTALSVNQFLDMVNDSLGVTGASNVRKLYTSKGKQIYDVSDLFNDETGIFIAVGNERFRADDIENILSDDNKGTSGNNKRTVKSLGKVSNPGMKHERENKRTLKEHDEKITERDNKKSSLPALPDLEVKKNKNNYEIRSKVADVTDNSSIHQKPQSPRHKKTVSKHNHSTTRENKNVESRSTDVNSNHVKLPQIGTGHNLVTSQEPQQSTTTKGKADNQDSPRGVAEEKEKLKESVEKEKNEKHAEQKAKKRPSKEFTNHEIEVEYSRVMDKKVEDVYDIGRKIGDGNFAIVRQCTNKTNKKEFALKIIDKKKIRGKEKMIDDEIAIMRKCRHPNIVRLFEDYDTATDIYLVMELIKGGDLFDAISSSVKFTENVAKTYFRDMCKALAYLHKQRVVHRDMKPENLLVSIYCDIIG